MPDKYLFLPSDVGNWIDPLLLPDDEADQIFGKLVMDFLREHKDDPPTKGYWEVISTSGTSKTPPASSV